MNYLFPYRVSGGFWKSLTCIFTKFWVIVFGYRLCYPWGYLLPENHSAIFNLLYVYYPSGNSLAVSHSIIINKLYIYYPWEYSLSVSKIISCYKSYSHYQSAICVYYAWGYLLPVSHSFIINRPYVCVTHEDIYCLWVTVSLSIILPIRKCITCESYQHYKLATGVLPMRIFITSESYQHYKLATDVLPMRIFITCDSKYHYQSAIHVLPTRIIINCEWKYHHQPSIRVSPMRIFITPSHSIIINQQCMYYPWEYSLPLSHISITNYFIGESSMRIFITCQSYNHHQSPTSSSHVTTHITHDSYHCLWYAWLVIHIIIAYECSRK